MGLRTAHTVRAHTPRPSSALRQFRPVAAIPPTTFPAGAPREASVLLTETSDLRDQENHDPLDRCPRAPAVHHCFRVRPTVRVHPRHRPRRGLRSTSLRRARRSRGERCDRRVERPGLVQRRRPRAGRVLRRRVEAGVHERGPDERPRRRGAGHRPRRLARGRLHRHGGVRRRGDRADRGRRRGRPPEPALRGAVSDRLDRRRPPAPRDRWQRGRGARPDLGRHRRRRRDRRRARSARSLRQLAGERRPAALGERGEARGRARPVPERRDRERSGLEDVHAGPAGRRVGRCGQHHPEEHPARADLQLQRADELQHAGHEREGVPGLPRRGRRRVGAGGRLAPDPARGQLDRCCWRVPERRAHRLQVLDRGRR